MFALLLALQAAPAVVPPPPMPPIVDCFPPGPFVVFFDRGSARLNREARSILDAVVRYESEACGGPFRFSIAGHADRGERAGVDRRRAAAVRDFVNRRGLRRLVGATRWLGSGVPRVLRPAGVEDRQNRRVEIEALPAG